MYKTPSGVYFLLLELDDKVALPDLVKSSGIARGKRRFSFKTVQDMQAARV